MDSNYILHVFSVKTEQEFKNSYWNWSIENIYNDRISWLKP